MNGHAHTVYSTLPRVCDLFFPIMYDLCAVSFDNDVLILPGAVSTPVEDGPYFFNVGSWLVNLPTMVYFSDWRESSISLVLFQFGCFTFSVEAFKQCTPKYVFWFNNI